MNIYSLRKIDRLKMENVDLSNIAKPYDLKL